MQKPQGDYEYIWSIRVPLLKNPLIRRQLLWALSPFFLLVLFLALLQAYYGLFLILALGILSFFFCWLVFRGTYDVTLTVNAKGIGCQTQAKQRKRVKRVASAVFWLGLLRGNPTAMGIGMLSGQTETFIPWQHIRKIKRAGGQTLLVRGGFAQNVALFCTEQNYRQLCSYLLLPEKDSK